MRLAIYLLAGLLFAAPMQASSAELLKSETGDHCVDQVLGHLRFLFGEHVTVGKAFKNDAREGQDVVMWVPSNLCDGYFVATYWKTSNCNGAHYGSMPIYIDRIYADGSCEDLLQKDARPRKENTLPYIRRPQ